MKEDKGISYYILNLANENFYNPGLKTVRVLKNSRFYDCWLSQTHLIPNPATCVALVITDDDFFLQYYLDSDALTFLPGIKNEAGEEALVGAAIAHLIPIDVLHNETYGNSSMANMNIASSSVSSSLDNRISITVPIPKDYTTPSNDTDVEVLRNENFGFFANKDGTIVIKGPGGCIIIGKEGIHIGGNLSHDNSGRKEGVTITNPFRPLIPPTIPTALLSGFKNLINPGTFLAIGEAGLKVQDIFTKAANVTQIASKFGSL